MIAALLLMANCLTLYPVTACSSTAGRVVTITVQSLEDQNEVLPISGYWVEGRVQLADGSLMPFKRSLTRNNWLGVNSVYIYVPQGVAAPVGLSRLTVIPRRDDRSVELK